jgi:hypothetical protein
VLWATVEMNLGEETGVFCVFLANGGKSLSAIYVVESPAPVRHPRSHLCISLGNRCCCHNCNRNSSTFNNSLNSKRLKLMAYITHNSAKYSKPLKHIYNSRTTKKKNHEITKQNSKTEAQQQKERNTSTLTCAILCPAIFFWKYFTIFLISE